jgi:hypothetical protein
MLLVNLTASRGRPISEIQYDGQGTYNVSLRSVRPTNVAAGKQLVLRAYSERVSVVIVIQDEMRMRHTTILPYMACPAQHFSTLSHKEHD